MTRQFFAQKIFSASFIIAILMVAVEVSIWAAVFSFTMLVWKWGMEKKGWKAPSKWIKAFLGALIFAFVIIKYRSLAGLDPGCTLLLAFSALRVIEYKNSRDHKFVVLSGFLLTSVKSLFTLDIYWLAPSAIAFLGLWYSLLPLALTLKGRFFSKLVAFSVPLSLMLFLVIPRTLIPWAMSRGGDNYGEVGFSEELNPGNVAELATLPNVAFRAKILNPQLQESIDKYWRGSNLTLSVGLSWKPGPRLRRDFNAGSLKDSVDYQVALEPTSQPYLFVLDGTESVAIEDNRVLSFKGFVFRAQRPIEKTSVYKAQWTKGQQDLEAPSEEFLKVPQLTGRVLEWVEATKSKNLSEQDRLSLVQDFFTSGGFVYTLKPGVYETNDLESFLFDRKMGFCEHFAGSYGTLVRALGIPSRVIVGYQGGRYNSLGDFWKVSQKDAHAWTEVFTEGTWRRVDPTSWVAPLRLAIGGEEFFALSEKDQQLFARNAAWRPRGSQQFLMWDKLTLWVEDLNYTWTYFLLEFDRRSQKEIWDRISDPRILAAALILAILLTLATVGLRAHLNKRKLSDEQLLIMKVERWGQKHKFVREPSEPPLLFLERLQKEAPELKEILQEIATYYDLKQYAQQPPRESASVLQRKWKRALRDRA